MPTVALCDRDADGLAHTAAAVEAAGRHARTATLDVRDGETVRAWIDTLDAVDVLVNNAGGGFFAAFLDVNDKGQDSLIRENFTSVTNFIRACVPKMPDAGGSIINVTSIEAHRAAPGFAVYSAMKAGVANLTKTLALELGDRHIRVNCIAPDVIPTPGIGDVPVKTPLPFAGDTRRHRRRGDLPRVGLVALRHGDDDPCRRRQPRRRRMGPFERRWLHDRRRRGRTVKFGVALGACNPHFHLDVTLEAERLGFESVWLPEHLVFTRLMTSSPHPGEEHPPVPPDTPVFDAFAYLAFLAAKTERIRIGTHVFNIGLRHPFTTARGVQTVDRLSGGRFDFGIGASWLQQEWDAVGLDFATRGRRVDEAIEICRRLWTEPTVSYHGEFFDFDEVAFEPKPIQQPSPPSSSVVSPRPRCAAPRASVTAGSGWDTPTSPPRPRSRPCNDCSKRTTATRPPSRSCSVDRCTTRRTSSGGSRSASPA